MTLQPFAALFKALEIRADIYHLHDPELLPIGFLLRWLFAKRVVFDMRESTRRQILAKLWIPAVLRPTASRAYNLIERLLLLGVKVIVANDRSAEEVPGCYVVRNFPKVDMELMQRALPMQQRCQKPLLVYIGGVWEGRGAHTYIDLIKALVERGRDVELAIIGHLESGCGPTLRQKIINDGLEERIRLFNFVDYDEAMLLASRAVIGLALLKPLPNYLFCLAGKIIEYMMCGTPVLASDFEHWRPYVEGERTGHVVDPCDLPSIVATCEKMLDSPEELCAMGKRGQRAVRSRYNWDREFQELLRCYAELLGH